MDETGEAGETAAVLRRLRRIERLRASSPAAVLGELRQLVPEAEAWARAGVAARAARPDSSKLGKEAEGMR
jgi:hypothetical protein